MSRVVLVDAKECAFAVEALGIERAKVYSRGEVFVGGRLYATLSPDGMVVVIGENSHAEEGDQTQDRA